MVQVQDGFWASLTNPQQYSGVVPTFLPCLVVSWGFHPYRFFQTVFPVTIYSASCLEHTHTHGTHIPNITGAIHNFRRGLRVIVNRKGAIDGALQFHSSAEGRVIGIPCASGDGVPPPEL